MGEPGAGWSYRRGASPYSRVEQLSDRLWLVVEDDRFNEHPFLYVIVGASLVVLVDTGVGTGDYATWLSSWMERTLGTAVAARPKLVVNTHCHFDHVGGNASFAGRPESELAASGRDVDFTLASLDPVHDGSLARKVGCAVVPFTVARWLSHGERLSLSDEEGDVIEVLWTPGHTPDSLCLWLAREQKLLVGDTVYPHAVIIVANPHSDLGEFAASIALLRAFVEELPAAHLCCGHVDAALGATSSLDEVAALVAAVRSGEAKPAPARGLAAGTRLYEQGLFSIVVRADDPALPQTSPLAGVVE